MNFRPILAVAAFLCLGLFAPSQPGFAQEGEQQQEQKTRRTEALSERVHRRLSDAQDALDIDDFLTSETKLREILEMRNITPYERAQTHRFMGYVHLKKDDFPRGIDAFLQVIQIGGPDVIGPGLFNEIIKVLWQLYMQVENYPEAIRYGLQWHDSQEDPQPRDYMLMASAYYYVGQFQDTVDYATQAIERAQASSEEVKESWWNLLLAAYFELEQYSDALEVSKILVTQWPKKQYWLQMGGLYAEVDDEDRQRAAYWSTYEQGLMERSQEITATAQLLMLAEVPYKAAQILQAGLNDGSIEATPGNYRLAAQAWQMSQENDKALDPLRKAAEGEEDAGDRGDLYLRLAESYNAVSEYEECAAAARDALQQGGFDNKGRTNMLLGQCLFELEKYDEAKEAFSDAADDPDQRRQATRWRNHVTKEVARIKDLEDRLAEYAD